MAHCLCGMPLGVDSRRLVIAVVVAVVLIGSVYTRVNPFTPSEQVRATTDLMSYVSAARAIAVAFPMPAVLPHTNAFLLFKFRFIIFPTKMGIFLMLI